MWTVPPSPLTNRRAKATQESGAAAGDALSPRSGNLLLLLLRLPSRPLLIHSPPLSVAMRRFHITIHNGNTARYISFAAILGAWEDRKARGRRRARDRKTVALLPSTT